MCSIFFFFLRNVFLWPLHSACSMFSLALDFVKEIAMPVFKARSELMHLDGSEKDNA